MGEEKPITSSMDSVTGLMGCAVIHYRGLKSIVIVQCAENRLFSRLPQKVLSLPDGALMRANSLK